MKLLFVIIYLIGCSHFCFSQKQNEEITIYNWSEIQDAHPDTIYGISFAKLKLETLPSELANFKNLRILDLRKNRISEIPNFMFGFEKLEIIDLEKNKLETFPVEFCRLFSLKQIKIGYNYFGSIPSCIGNLSNLEYLDLYDNPLGDLPTSLANLPNLKKVDLSGIRFSPSFQNSWKARLPMVELVFDAPCDCME